MKIAFLSFYSGYVHRGMETIVHELAKRVNQKHQLTVLQAGPQYRAQTYPLKTLSSQNIFSFTLKALKVIKQLKPDIIMPTNGGWQTLLIKLYCITHKTKMIVSGQAGLGRPDRWNLLLKPDVFIALTQRNAHWAKKHSWQVNIKVIPNGVDLNLFKTQGKKISLNLPQPVILCVAGPERYKQVEATIQVVANLKQGSLLLAGGGDRQTKLGQAVLGKRFLRKKFSHQQMPAVYRTADVFTLVSQSTEAFGIVYLEALATGLPVVALDDQLRREILGPHAVYVKDPSNIKDYATKLNQALKLPKQRPDSWLKQYSWDTIASKYQKAFQHALKNK